jgi:hypothetical protein
MRAQNNSSPVIARLSWKAEAISQRLGTNSQFHYLSQTSKIASLEFTLNEVNVLTMTVCGMITSLALLSEGK